MIDASMYWIPVNFDPVTNTVTPAHWLLWPALMLCIYTHITINFLCGTDYQFPIKRRDRK